MELEVVTDGAGDEAVVLLPSLGRDSYEFDPIASDLADAGFLALRPQPRGVGASRGTLTGLDLHDLAADVAVVLDRFGVAPAVLAGHAFGHYVARVLAADRPELVRGVAVLAAGARRFPASLTERVAKCSDFTLADSERLEHLRAVFFAEGHDPSVWLDGWWPDAIAAQRAAMAATDKESWWTIAPSPLLDVQAGDDVFRPPETRSELVDEFGPDLVTTALIRGSGHALVPEVPHEVARVLIEWIHTLDRGPEQHGSHAR
ncbi:alpha/beta hydrolase [Rhodococcus sp. CC-R104]|uniref:Alpha/beta hydrolase n=2 Tax=Rhodococcus chondri TaxID=3065941 RepID=A0ABU7JMV3_9NOCA|nr:alpha/beta hydrolase [Rhodococcus sp. CC-R104]MEE2031361.1 alpha/beta hydrolase [Rhodococcus sp. CC-R104]